MVDNPPRNGITMKNTQQPGQCTDLKKKKKSRMHCFGYFAQKKISHVILSLQKIAQHFMLLKHWENNLEERS